MEQNNSNAENFELLNWLEIVGDIDDFIFYCEPVHQSEK